MRYGKVPYMSVSGQSFKYRIDDHEEFCEPHPIFAYTSTVGCWLGPDHPPLTFQPLEGWDSLEEWRHTCLLELALLHPWFEAL